MEKPMTNLIRKFEGYCAYLTIEGPNFFVAKNALRVQGWLHQLFPKIFPNSPYNQKEG